MCSTLLLCSDHLNFWSVVTAKYGNQAMTHVARHAVVADHINCLTTQDVNTLIDLIGRMKGHNMTVIYYYYMP